MAMKKVAAAVIAMLVVTGAVVTCVLGLTWADPASSSQAQTPARDRCGRIVPVLDQEPTVTVCHKHKLHGEECLDFVHWAFYRGDTTVHATFAIPKGCRP